MTSHLKKAWLVGLDSSGNVIVEHELCPDEDDHQTYMNPTELASRLFPGRDDLTWAVDAEF